MSATIEKPSPHHDKTRISATLDRELLKWIQEGVKSRRFASVSHGIEYSIQLAMDSEKKRPSATAPY